MLKLRAPSIYFWRFVLQVRVIMGVWAKFTGGTILLCLIFGPIAPLAAAAFIFTILLPVGLLTLWGSALEAELGWTDPARWRR